MNLNRRRTKNRRHHKMVQPIIGVLFSLVALTAESSNVLIVVADDLGLDYFEKMCPELYGLETSETIAPTINDFCQRAVFFSNAWAYTLCSPTRASMLTGRFGFRNGVTEVQGEDSQSIIEEYEMTIPKVLSAMDSGYSHANIGKWHLQSATVDGEYPIKMGWDYYYGLLGGAVTDYSNWLLTESTLLSNGEIEVSQLLTPQEEYVTSNFSNRASQWIDEKSEQEQPWLLWLAYTAPHSPFHKPPVDLLEGSSFTELPESGASDAEYYQSMIYAMDTELARVLESVDLTDTFIVFLGDNGSPDSVVSSELAGKAKGSIYEGGLRVPLMIIPPNNGSYSGPKQINDLVHSVDIFPTVLEMAGQDFDTLKTSGGLLANIDHDGISLFDYITDENLVTSPNARASLYNEVSPFEDDGARTARSNNFKLVRQNNGVEELYALNCAYSVAGCVNTFLATETTDFLKSLSVEELPQRLGRAYKSLSNHLNLMEVISSCEEGIADPDGSNCDSLY